MTMTVLIPHKRNAGNDAALSICLQCLMANTVNPFVLTLDMRGDLPIFAKINRMVIECESDCCLLLSSDMFVAPQWDVPMLAAYDDYNTWVTNVLVEPGAIGVYSENITEDFGRRPDQFRRADFEAWCATAPMPSGIGWVQPLMFSRQSWLDMGGIDTRGNAADEPRDQMLINQWLNSGHRVERVRSYTYHLQKYSDESEQTHEKRDKR